MGDGSFEAGFSPLEQQYHANNAGNPYVYSGYLGRPAYGNELPDYEKSAYGFPTGGQQPGWGAGGNFVGWDQQGSNGIWTNKKTGERSWNPGGGQGGGFPPPGGGGGGFPQGGGQYSGSQSYANGGMGDTAYQQAATNAVSQMYNRIRSRKQTSVNTDMARRGISSSGVAGGIMGDSMHELDLNETADIAKIWQQGGGGSGSSSGSGQANYPGGGEGFGPGNMGGFGARLPGFNSAPGGKGAKFGGVQDENGNWSGNSGGNILGGLTGFYQPPRVR